MGNYSRPNHLEHRIAPEHQKATRTHALLSNLPLGVIWQREILSHGAHYALAGSAWKSLRQLKLWIELPEVARGTLGLSGMSDHPSGRVLGVTLAWTVAAFTANSSERLRSRPG